MSKVIVFSRFFPVYHPKAGKPTFFIEQILTNLIKQGLADTSYLKSNFVNINALDMDKQKKHTIRKGNRFKAGDKFSPRIWSGKPYASKQMIIAPDIKVKKVYDFEIKRYDNHAFEKKFFIDFGNYSINEDMDLQQTILPHIAKNDGLSLDDFVSWFKFPKQEFKGQIICWSDDVNY